jgi:flagellar biosynthesis protein FlhF
MRKARQDLGDDARLVSARRVSSAAEPPLYEVRVTSAPEPSPLVGGGLDELRREIESLRETIRSLAAAPAGPRAEPEREAEEEDVDPDFARWLEVMRRRGIGRAAARRIVRGTRARLQSRAEEDPFHALQRTIAAQFPRAEDEDPLGERSTIFLGSAGAGKTTVLAKVAAEEVARGRRPVLVTTDGESLAGEETLYAVATALGLRLETAFLDGQLESLIERLGPGETILVDTPGRTPYEREGLSALEAVVHSVPGAEVVLVIPATTDAEEARILLEAYETLGVERIVLTKMDVLARPGRLVDLARTITRPVAWVTYGRGVRGASSPPSDPRIIARILGTELAVAKTA